MLADLEHGVAMRFIKTLIIIFVICGATTLRADDARFDLHGPSIDVKVTRGGITLPVMQVPNLLPNDQLHLKLDLSANQSNHLLLIVAFLRTSTNEPPDDWFTKIETWNLPPSLSTTVVVPEGATHALLFIAPETGGDFKTLRSAVKGNPGLFIRANLSLNKASFEQQRIERYLKGMQAVALEDTKTIAARSAKLATSLALKPNADCFKQPVEDQVDCLTQQSTPTLLDDGHGPSFSSAVSTGASSDFLTEAGTAPDGGNYSPYVGTLVDLIHLVGTLRTAQYRYIPAITFPEDSTLILKLNAPPSFYNPKSVIVVGLPVIRPTELPRMRTLNDERPSCLLNPSMTMSFRGAPLLFSTGLAHELLMEVDARNSVYELPLRVDALHGGLMVDDEGKRQNLLSALRDGDETSSRATGTIKGRIHGQWGFDSFLGPQLTFQVSPGRNWKVTDNDQFIAGQDAQLNLVGDNTECIEKITLNDAQSISKPVTVTPDDATNPDRAKLDVSLKGVAPGPYSIMVKQFGSPSLVRIPVNAYDSQIHFEHVLTHPGDGTALLVGNGVEKVVSVEIGGHAFLPAGTGGDDHSLQLRSQRGSLPATAGTATVVLKNGRTLSVPAVAQEAGATLQLLSVESVPEPQQNGMNITLNGEKDLALGTLHFVVQSRGPFPHSQTIEVATVDGANQTTLSLGSGNLILQDEHTAVAAVNLTDVFDSSAFGPLRFRAVPKDGAFGEWVPLGTLVRIPRITAVTCKETNPEHVCKISGIDLFLVSEFSMNSDFNSSAPVPTGFNEATLVLPLKPTTRDAILYMRLRDDPQSVAAIRLSDEPNTESRGPLRTDGENY